MERMGMSMDLFGVPPNAQTVGRNGPFALIYVVLETPDTATRRYAPWNGCLCIKSRKCVLQV